jgi:hypothetical protein
MKTDTAAPQVDSQPDSRAGETDPTSGDTDASDDDGNDHHDDDGKNREAAKLRKRAQKVEAERDEARDMLTKTRQAILDNAAAAAGLTERHMTAAGIDGESMLGDDGLPDMDKLAKVIADAAREFNVRRAPKPVRQQGTNANGSPRGESSWSQALKPS